MRVSLNFTMVFTLQAAIIATVTKPLAWTLPGIFVLSAVLWLTFLAYLAGRQEKK